MIIMRTNPKPLSKRLNFFVISFFVFFLSSQAYAFNPIGFYEGLMGNSGVALTEPTAASYYNPSLLILKPTSSVSLGGNTFSNFKSNVDGVEWSSAQLSPSYLSSVQAFDVFVHEFFLSQMYFLDTQITTQSNGGIFDYDIRTQGYYAGYSFAFKGFPMGFQFVLRVSDQKTIGFYSNETPQTVVKSDIRGSNRKADMMLGLGAHHQFGDYTFGYRYLSRGARVYSHDDGKTTSAVFNLAGNTYSKIESDFKLDSEPLAGQIVVIGHSFKAGSHEYLTDTQMEEDGSLTNSFTWIQTFGYRLNFDKQNQFLCGIAHQIGSEIKYFGQSAYYSAGYSWLTRANRSAVGLYYTSQNLDNDMRVYGVTFSSEFTY